MLFEDMELKEIVQVVGKWLLAVIIFGGLFTILLVKRFGAEEISVNRKIDSKQTVIVFVTTSKMSSNKDIKNILGYKCFFK